MAAIRQILQRHKAVSSIARLTKTMQIVSTAAFKSYYRKWTASGEYHAAMAQAGYLLVSPQTPIDHPLLKENTSGRSAVLVIGSRGGLCGAYNSHMYRLLETHLAMAKSSGKTLEVCATSGRLINLLRQRGIVTAKVYTDVDELPTDVQIHRIAKDFIEAYIAGSLDSFSVIHMGFYSAGHQHSQTMTIMPLTELIDHWITRTEVIWPWDLAFEDFAMSPSPGRTLEALAHMIMHAAIKSCFMDAALCEHVARMVAMRNANKNADDMMRELGAEYNRARQTQITGELLDIIGGMGALT